jgi:hypothetical protein
MSPAWLRAQLEKLSIDTARQGCSAVAAFLGFGSG